MALAADAWCAARWRGHPVPCQPDTPGAALAGDVLAGGALAGDALAGDALAGDALAGDALAGAALAGTPGPALQVHDGTGQGPGHPRVLPGSGRPPGGRRSSTLGRFGPDNDVVGAGNVLRQGHPGNGPDAAGDLSGLAHLCLNEECACTMRPPRGPHRLRPEIDTLP